MMKYLKSTYGERCLTKSENYAVLIVYKFILEHENCDTDYWWGGGGDSDLIRILETHLTDFDWEDLEKDLNNWSNVQLELFLYCIMSIDGYNFEHDKIYQERRSLIRKRTRSVPNRTDLILPILQIGIDRDVNKNEIALIVSNEFFFFENHFEILIDEDPRYLSVMDQILNLIGKDYIYTLNPKFKVKHEAARR